MARSQAAVELEDELDGIKNLAAATVEAAPTIDSLKRAAEEPTPADPLPDAADPITNEDLTKATVRAKAKPFVFDDVSGVLTVNDAHGSFETSLMGINPRVEWQLAAIGLASLLKGRIDKDKVIENIKAGQFGGKRRQKYPATVIAYANYQNITVDESWAQWQALSVAERMTIRSMPKVRLELAKLADAAESKE
jgi:hypothetical protein